MISSLQHTASEMPNSKASMPYEVSSPSLIRHPDMWFPDGSVILQAECTIFRVHMSQLARHSAFFRDLFSLPQPSSNPSSKSEDTTTTIEGCPVIVLHDSAEDLGNLLVALYDGPTFGSNDRDDFRRVSGLLRLSTKYIIDSLRIKSLAHLCEAWPLTLKDWDNREDIARGYEIDTTTPRGFRYPSPIAVIRLAREVNAPALLPAAFYDLSRYHFSQIFESTEDDPLYAQPSALTLAPTDLHCLAVGKEAAQHHITNLIQSMGTPPKLYYPPPPSHSHSGAAHRRKHSGQVCVTVAACRKDLAELVELATQHYLFDREKGCSDPLYVAEELGQLKSPEFSECKACAKSLETWATREREKIWKLIPLWFRLDV